MALEETDLFGQAGTNEETTGTLGDVVDRWPPSAPAAGRCWQDIIKPRKVARGAIDAAVPPAALDLVGAGKGLLASNQCRRKRPTIAPAQWPNIPDLSL